MPLVIIGLGNPGREYEGTRHNVGRALLGFVSEKFQIPLEKKQGEVLFGEGVWNGQRLILVFPLTFMNLSGKVVAWLKRQGAGDPSSWILLQDDLDTPFGMVRFREKGGAGGQHGVESILAVSGSKNIARIKVGIGRPLQIGADVSHYVLSPFSREEKERLPSLFAQGVKLLETWLRARSNP